MILDRFVSFSYQTNPSPVWWSTTTPGRRLAPERVWWTDRLANWPTGATRTTGRAQWCAVTPDRLTGGQRAHSSVTPRAWASERPEGLTRSLRISAIGKNVSDTVWDLCVKSMKTSVMKVQFQIHDSFQRKFGCSVQIWPAEGAEAPACFSVCVCVCPFHTTHLSLSVFLV